MSTGNILMTPSSLLNEAALEAEYKAAEKWEAWYLGLRAHLHWMVNEEHGGASALEQFFDAYGLSLEASYGNPAIVRFLEAMPPEPSKQNPDFPSAGLLERIFAAAQMKTVEFSKEKLPQVASSLREKADAFVRLADKIESGDFSFPKP